MFLAGKTLNDENIAPPVRLPEGRVSVVEYCSQGGDFVALERRQPGRNDPCHCGSRRKYKQCCLDKDEAVARAARLKAAAETPATAGEVAPSAPAPVPKKATQQPWKRSATNTRGFQRMSAPRKVGSG